MPYLAVELDALNAAPNMARAAGIEEDTGIAGLLRLWAHCFRGETDHVTTGVVCGLFGGDGARVAQALADFGFLEARPAGDWRVRGADRYLRLKAARREGGRKASRNLVPGGKHRADSLGSTSAPAELQPSSSLGSTSALTPNTEHRAPSTDKKRGPFANANERTPASQAPVIAPPPATEPPFKRSEPNESAPEQRMDGGDLLEDLACIYAEVRSSPKPRWGMREARDCQPLLAHEPAEVLRRARIAFARKSYPRCATPRELAQHWDHYDREEATGPPGRRAIPPPKPVDPNRPLGEVRNEF